MGMEALGLYIVLDSNIIDEIKALTKKITILVNTIKSRKLSVYEIFLYVNITILKTIENLLLVTTLSKQEC